MGELTYILRHGRTLAVMLLTFSVLILLKGGISNAAEPVPFTSTSGTCLGEHEEEEWTTAPLSSPHPNVIERFSATDTARFNFGFVNFAGTGVVWGPPEYPSLVGEVYNGFFSCPRTMTYSVAIFDVPSTPTTFAGSGSVGTTHSILVFYAPSEAQYVAHLALGGGPVAISTLGGRVQTFASSGTFQLGTLPAGYTYLLIAPEEGPPAIWSVNIHALPVALSGVGFDKSVTAPGKIVHLKYTTSGSTAVSAVVVDANGSVVRTLSTSLNVKRGEHKFAWDGRRDSGSLVPDGRYIAQVSTSDPGGGHEAGSATLHIDRGPQTFWKRKPSKSGHKRTVRFAFRADEADAKFQCEYAGGWRPCTSPKIFHLVPGRYVFAVRAVDRFGVVDPKPDVWHFRILP